MANHLDLPYAEASEIIALDKTAPLAKWVAISSGRVESWFMATGVVAEGGVFKRAITIELICKRSQKPYRDMFKFCLFKAEHGTPRRAYQLDTTNLPICDHGDHDWPHEHLGNERVSFGHHAFPSTFEESLEHFCRAVNITFDEPVESPFEFKLR